MPSVCGTITPDWLVNLTHDCPRTKTIIPEPNLLRVITDTDGYLYQFLVLFHISSYSRHLIRKTVQVKSLNTRGIDRPLRTVVAI